MKTTILSLKKAMLASAICASAAFVTVPALAQTNNAPAATASTTGTQTMNHWSQQDLDAIIKADDLHISPFREDHKTYGTPTWIWCVAVDGNLYVRAYHGQQSSWYKAAVREKAGRIIAAGMTREVTFEAVPDAALNDRIDAAYKAKYAGSGYLPAMTGARARSATVRIIPKD